MKNIFRALLAGTAFACASVHAYSLHDAITNGKVSGEIRNTYARGSDSAATSEAGAMNNSNVLGSALSLGYETGSYHGFKVGVAFQAGHDWSIQDENGLTTAGGEEDHRVAVDSTNLYRAYLDYTFDPNVTDTRVRIGRQKLVSPLIMNSGAFPMQDAFDAVVVENRDIGNTSIQFIGIDRWVMRYGEDSNGSLTQEDKDYEEPIYSLYVKNGSISGLDVEAQWLDNGNETPAGDPPAAAVTADAYTAGFIGATYMIPETRWGLGAKALRADYDRGPDTGYWGVRALTGVGPVDVQLAYTSVDDEANFPGTLGHVPMFRSYTPGYIDEIFAGLKTTSLSLGYGFGIKGLEAILGYSDWEQSEAGITNSGKDLDGGHEINLDLLYKVKSIEGLSARLKASYMDFDQTSTDNDDFSYVRVSLNYGF